ncbi:hypothetical protein AN643_03835, partial [Candidatus Epulonipiscioides saccharophilum]
LQASGEWTWDVFVEICEKLTRDTDNDGVFDVYAIDSEPTDMIKQILISNNARTVEIDENGKFYNGTKTPQAIRALEWFDYFYDLPYDLAPTNYQGHQDLFRSGKVAMYYGNEGESKAFAEMSDDYGFVCFPKGPDAEHYVVGTNATAWVIPNTYTKEEAENIAFVINIWMNDPPGYDGPDDWMAAKYPLFRDERAVEETLAIARLDTAQAMFDYRSVVFGVDVNQIANPVYYNEKTVAEAIEAVAPVYDAAIAKANGE